MTEIALAYSSMDKARAEAVGRVLGALGYTLAPQPLTAQAVDAARALIVFWSSGSVNSIPINQFASQASCDRKLVSVRAGHADPPAAYALVALHDLSRWTGNLDAPELRTFLQHVLRMAPPANAAQQTVTPQAVAAQRQPAPAAAGAPFAFAGPMGAAVRPGEATAATAAPTAPTSPPVREPPPVAAMAPRRVARMEQPADQAPMDQPTDRRAAVAAPPPSRPRPENPRDRPSIRRAEERRRAAGGGAARVAFGAIAVSVIAGAAVAAFNYDGGQQQSASTAPGGAESDKAADIAIAVAPNTLASAEPTTVSDAIPTEAAPAPVQVAAATPAPAPATSANDAAATVQSNRGWTATLPTLPPQTVRAAPSTRPTMTATPVSAGAPPRPARAPRSLTPIDSTPAPAPTDIVAVDGANLGGPDDPPSGRPKSPEEERAWIRRNAEYGPTQ